MIIKFNNGTDFKIGYCTEKINNSSSSLIFDILGDYSASYIQEEILKQEEAIYTLIDEEGMERRFLNYTEIHSIESFYEEILSETSTTVTLRKANSSK